MATFSYSLPSLVFPSSFFYHVSLSSNTLRSGPTVTILWCPSVRWSWTVTLRTTLLRWSSLCLSHQTCHLELNHLPTKCSRYYWLPTTDFMHIEMALWIWSGSLGIVMGIRGLTETTFWQTSKHGSCLPHIEAPASTVFVIISTFKRGRLIIHWRECKGNTGHGLVKWMWPWNFTLALHMFTFKISAYASRQTVACSLLFLEIVFT